MSGRGPNILITPSFAAVDQQAIHRQVASAFRGHNEPVVAIPRASITTPRINMPPPASIPQHSSMPPPLHVPSRSQAPLQTPTYPEQHGSYHTNRVKMAKTASGGGGRPSDLSSLRISVRVTAARNTMVAGKNKIVEIEVHLCTSHLKYVLITHL